MYHLEEKINTLKDKRVKSPVILNLYVYLIINYINYKNIFNNCTLIWLYIGNNNI